MSPIPALYCHRILEQGAVLVVSRKQGGRREKKQKQGFEENRFALEESCRTGSLNSSVEGLFFSQPERLGLGREADRSPRQSPRAEQTELRSTVGEGQDCNDHALTVFSVECAHQISKSSSELENFSTDLLQHPIPGLSCPDALIRTRQ
ncbi:hypothetical protein RRG08_028517 [Elysia crispata]|uniref:Uncharacterized protein n=1 Tax=Elysia crispata TaxID=231223 RepID=A0AAE0YAB8_9GAST|nr:hypothetical protein RRG08_028517 [Elysia crispata]